LDANTSCKPGPAAGGQLAGAKFDGATGRYLFGQLCLAAQLQRDLDSERMTGMLARNRAIAGFAAVGAKLVEVGDHEERLRALKANQQGRAADETDAFPDVDP